MAAVSLSPGRRAWQRFRRNRLVYWSLLLFGALVVASLFAESDKASVESLDAILSEVAAGMEL